MNHNNYGLDPLVVYMRKKQDTMANEMDTNRIMWNTDEGKRKSVSVSMNQQDMVEEAMANAIGDTIMRIVNGEDSRYEASNFHQLRMWERKSPQAEENLQQSWAQLRSPNEMIDERYGKRRIRLGIED